MNILETLLVVIIASIATFIGITIIQRLFIAGLDLYYKLQHNKKQKSAKKVENRRIG